jgi:hypothetical protein
MPWVPELFSAPVLQELLDKRRRQKLVAVPYFDGLLSGEPGALLESFAGEPEVHDPIRGRIKGARAFSAFAAHTREWLVQRNASIEDREHVVLGRRGFEEVVVHLDGENGRVELPFVIVADREADGRIDELRIYYSSWPLTGRHVNRPPLLQPDPDLHASDVVAEYQRALAIGDVDAILAALEPDGTRACYERWFSNGGGIPLEHCRLIDDGRVCALEFNVVRWGTTHLPPQAGVAVYVRGESGKLAVARVYHDADPPLARKPALGGGIAGV